MSIVFPIFRIRPKPGLPLETMEVPGKGLYDLIFRVPTWFPDFDRDEKFSAKIKGRTLVHERTRVDGKRATLRFRVLGDDPPSKAGTAQTESILVFGGVVAAILAVSGVVALIEARKLVEAPGGLILAAGGGLLLLATGAGKLKKGVI